MIGIAMIAAGFLFIGIIGLLSGVWLALVGWFVFQSAGAEAAAVSSQGRGRPPGVRAAGR